ncbi:adenylate kinase [Ferviditalea candida]|uniref:Adenylate kinase n=1 Tax=Ferviditalea candida TaxID=3108399 RepID=A0ABU5ZJJ6_9BACL|nr:adenylate kinase [Paenibacillaceae bacterium T2]
MILILLGPPGSGKGTQAQKTARQLAVPHLSVGDLLRKEAAKQSALGKQIGASLKQGELVSEAITLQIVRERIQQTDCENGFVIDGFPRTVQQAQTFNKLLNKLRRKPDHVLWIDVDAESLLERLSGRRICPNCKAIYHVKFRPPLKPGICDRCGQILIQRSDDTPSVIEKRIRQSLTEMEKLKSFYHAQGILRTIDGNREEWQISDEIMRIIRNVRLFMTIEV